MSVLLQVKDLATHFLTTEGVATAVDGISYDIKEGETVALVGESGCGKTVSALSLVRLVSDPPGRIVRGQVIFCGKDLLMASKQDMQRVRGKEIAMVFQEPMTSLNPVLSVGYQIAERLRIHKAMKKKEAFEKTEELLRAVGIPDPGRRIRDYAHQFSGGMRQRIMMALALSCDPKLLIADEPTTSVDVTIQAQLLETLKGLTIHSGVAVLLITHNLGIVARYADRVNIMYAGRFVEMATSGELFRNPRHPYTQGLLATVPRLDQNRTTKLPAIKGSPPDLFNRPPGCAFHPRCEMVEHWCREEPPPLVAVTDNHGVACWRETQR